MGAVRVVPTHLERALVYEIHLDRPERANALDSDTVELIHAALTDAEQDNADVVVLSSTAPRVFSAGFDMSTLADESDADLLYRMCRIEMLFERLNTAAIPTVAKVTGAAVGAGADLVVACSYRFAESGASLRFPGAGFGAVLGVQRLARITSPDIATRLVASGQKVCAEQAAALGVWSLLEGETAWTENLQAIAETSLRLPATTFARLAIAAEAGTGPDPLGQLVRSLIGTPGLRDRMQSFRNGPSPAVTLGS